MGLRMTAQELAKHQGKAAKPSKYRNVRTEVLGEMFDSEKEAKYWLILKAREKAGEIHELRRQVEFPLLCPVRCDSAADKQVSAYIADFAYITRDEYEFETKHVVDVKGHKTKMYLLKKKWLEIQDGIIIEELF